MRYELLPVERWDQLTHLIPPEKLPAPTHAVAAVALSDNDEIMGVLFLQPALHIEPMVLTSPRVSFKALYDVLYNSLDVKGLHFYCFSDREVVDGMAEFVGMQRLPYRVYEGEVK